MKPFLIKKKLQNNITKRINIDFTRIWHYKSILHYDQSNYIYQNLFLETSIDCIKTLIFMQRHYHFDLNVLRNVYYFIFIICRFLTYLLIYFFSLLTIKYLSFFYQFKVFLVLIISHDQWSVKWKRKITTGSRVQKMIYVSVLTLTLGKDWLSLSFRWNMYHYFISNVFLFFISYHFIYIISSFLDFIVIQCNHRSFF